MKERTPPSSSTSMPPSFTSVTVPVTTWPLRGAPAAGARLLDRVAVELLDAQADALLLNVDVQHLGLDPLALRIILDGFLARLGPGEVGQVHHAVHVRIQADEQPELGDGLDLAL